ncbi:MAG TPA: lysophospholipid acyltransferase family protein [Nitrospiraceae bacterium]
MLNWLKLNILPPIGAALIRLLGGTLRIRTEGGEQVDALYRKGHHLIIAFWHGRQLMMPLTYRGTNAHILISRHRDGELIHRIVSRFGFRSVRGSTTRGGASALRDLIRLGRSGADLVITPDGPKGPRHVAQSGAVQLAQATGLPIVPLTFSCSKKNSLRAGMVSWSRTRSAGASFAGAIPSGCRVTRRRGNWKPSGASWRRR